ncbi:MAG: DoxX family protein [Mesorhizobium sp.]
MAMRVIYWVSTLAFTAFYLFSVFGYLTQHDFWAAEYVRLGYPAYLIAIMTVVKPLGVLAVWARRPVWLAQLAYAGFFFHTLLAANAHFQLGEAAGALALVLLVCAIASWATQNFARSPAAAYAPAP